MRYLIHCIGLAVLLSACTEKLEDMNVDVKNATTASPESFFGASVLNLARLMGQNFSGPSVDMPVGVGLYLSQQLTNATHTTEPRYFYDGNTDWDFVYKSVLRNLYEAEKLLVAEQANGGENLEIANKLASIAILKVYTYTVLVDIFGNVPYSQALDVDNVTPVYDDAESVYLDLIERLNQAIAALDASVASFGDYDLLYNGDVSKWQKFANSLKLRFGLKVIDVLPELGSTLATEAIEAGVFSGNEDNAVFHFLSSPPNNHSLWVVLVQNPRLFYVGAKPFVDLMNAYEDPRRAVYFSRLNGGFVGGQIGLVLNYNSYSHLGDYFHRPDLPCILLDFSNVSFLLAEAAERGIAGGTDAKRITRQLFVPLWNIMELTKAWSVIICRYRMWLMKKQVLNGRRRLVRKNGLRCSCRGLKLGPNTGDWITLFWKCPSMHSSTRCRQDSFILVQNIH